MSEGIEVVHEGGDKFRIRIRDHEVTVDQPVAAGGEDTAPTPTELYVASLASCVAFYARRFLARHDLPTDGLAVTADFTMAARPARVGSIDVAITIPDGVPDDRLAALIAVATHCTVHNSFQASPEVRIEATKGRAGSAPGSRASIVA